MDNTKFDRIHTVVDCAAKVKTALDCPQYILKKLQDSKIEKQLTAKDILEQIIPIMVEAESCFNTLLSKITVPKK